GLRRAGGPAHGGRLRRRGQRRSEEHTSELQSQSNLVCRLLLEKKKKKKSRTLPGFSSIFKTWSLMGFAQMRCSRRPVRLAIHLSIFVCPRSRTLLTSSNVRL